MSWTGKPPDMFKDIIERYCACGAKITGLQYLAGHNTCENCELNKKVK